MFRKKIIFYVLLMPSIALTQVPKNVDVFGWINVEYGRSSSDEVLGEKKGDDRLGVQQSAIGVKVTKGKYEGAIAIGGDNLSSGDGDGSNFAIRDSFIVYNNKKDGNFKISVGAQPILFGLKPNGYPGDRSIRPSLEYGGAGAYNVGFQGLTSAKFDYYLSGLELNLVLFDTNETDGTAEADSGSSIEQNTALQVRFKDLGVNGLYGSIGQEKRYLGSTDKSEAITSIGLGYDHKYFDLSIEQISLHKQFTGTEDDESILVTELTGKICKDLIVYVDLAQAKESELKTSRQGIKYNLDEISSLQLEYGKEERASSKPETYDLRWQIKF